MLLDMSPQNGHSEHKFYRNVKKNTQFFESKLSSLLKYLFKRPEIWWRNLFFKKNINLAVLGMEQSGKTSFYNFLRLGNPMRPDGTPVEDSYDSFSIKDSEGYKLTITKGKDISGRKEHVHLFYSDMVKENEMILFLFNSSKFCQNEEYMLDVVDRIALISEFISRDSGKQFFIAPTFKDCLHLSDRDFKEMIFQSLLSDKSASKFAKSEHLLPACITNDIQSLENLRDKIFSTYRRK